MSSDLMDLILIGISSFIAGYTIDGYLGRR